MVHFSAKKGVWSGIPRAARDEMGIVPGMLILFDIDATLLTSSRSGVLALEHAGRDLFGSSFTIEGVDFAGRLDPLIIADLLRRNGQEVSRPAMTNLRATYTTRLPEYLNRPGAANACRGVDVLLEALRREVAIGTVTLGLLTGNFENTGSLKLRTCGIEPEWFEIRVWGDDSPHDPPARDHLPAVAFERYRAARGREINGRKTVIIGDTPHDVKCALAHGCRSLGVGTGQFTPTQLAACGADWAVQDLSDTDAVVSWLLKDRRATKPESSTSV